jgi:hypothetical protein
MAEGRRRDAPRVDPDVVLRLALARHVEFVDPAWKEPQKVAALQEAAESYVRNMFFRPDATPYQTLGLEPGAPYPQIRESFRLLMQLVHPDRQGARKIWPDACAAQANSAYAALKDQDTRRTFEEEADARAALARAINRAAVAAEASRMPTVTWWQKPRAGKAPFRRPMLPEWLTAGVGGYARQNPATTVFGVLIAVAVSIVGATFLETREGPLVRMARETPAPAIRATPGAAADAATASDAGLAATPDPAPARRRNPDADRRIVLASAAPGIGIVSIPSERMAAPPRAEPARPTRPDSGAPVSTAPAQAEVRAAVPEAPLALSPALQRPESAPVPRTQSPDALVPAASPVVARVDPGLAPDGVRDANAQDAAATSPPANAEIEALFASFVESYERGRLDTFASLFDADADTNLRRGRAAIRGEYDELFRLSQWRRMQLTRISWRQVGDRTIAKGEIAVRIGWRDGREVEQRLNIDMELMRRDGRVVIARLSHQPKTP